MAQLGEALSPPSTSTADPASSEGPASGDAAARKAWREARMQAPGVQASLSAKVEQAQDTIRASSGAHAGKRPLHML